MRTADRQQWSCQVDKQTAEKYKQYFREHGIYFEPSECFDQVYISFWLSEEALGGFKDWFGLVL